MSSDLTNKEQKEFLAVLATTKDADLLSIIELIDEDSTWTRRLYQNFLDKKFAIMSQDPDAWQQIIEEEAQELKAMQ